MTSVSDYATKKESTNFTEAAMLCNPYEFVGHQDIPEIITPLSPEMQKRTLTFDQLREKFQRLSNDTLFQPGCTRRDNLDEKLVRVFK